MLSLTSEPRLILTIDVDIDNDIKYLKEPEGSRISCFLFIGFALTYLRHFKALVFRRYTSCARRMRCLHSYVITLLLIWVQTTQGFNDTITTPGWRSEPDGRGTWSILWTCLVTIFLCTWSSLHLSVKDQHDWWYLFFRQVRWMLLVA